MTNYDKEYLKLLRKILEEGVEVENRTGINTIKIPEYNFSFDLSKEFPILQSKQMFYRQAVIEMLWIWQMGCNDVRELQDRGVHIWDEWMVDEDGIYRIYEPTPDMEYLNDKNPCTDHPFFNDYDDDEKERIMKEIEQKVQTKIANKEYKWQQKEVEVIDPLSVPVDDPFGLRHDFKPKSDENGKVMKAKSIKEGRIIKMAKYYGPEYAYTIGTAYGFITNRYQHARNLIDTIKNTPTDRRMVKSLWQDEYLRTAVLPSCVWSTEWDVTDGKLNLFVHQRSCDVPLGLPFNVTQYATLLSMIAKTTGLKAGKINYSIKDAHIYVNQVEGIKEQIRREDRYNELLKTNRDDLIKLKNCMKGKLDKLDKNSDEFKELDTDYRIIDLILEPTTPILELSDEVEDFFDYDNSKEIKHVKVRNYKHMGKISFPLAQ